MKKLVIVSLALLLLVIVPACITVQAPAPGTDTPAGVIPVIIEFSNTPATITPGGSSTLLWNVTGANMISIDQGIGQVTAAGTRLISPAKSTVYTISATNATGTVIRSSAICIVAAIVTASAATPQTAASNPVIQLTAIHRGGPLLQLNWNVSNATQIVIQPEVGPIEPAGSTVVKVPSGQTKLYRLEAVNDWGWAYWQVVMANP